MKTDELLYSWVGAILLLLIIAASMMVNGRGHLFIWTTRP